MLFASCFMAARHSVLRAVCSKKFIFTIICLSTLSGILFSQSKRDTRWVLGYCSCLPGSENTDDLGGMYLTFEDGIASIEKFDIFSDSPMSTANDENGNLLFYSTGCTIFNREMEVMDNGQDVNPASDCQTDKSSYTYIRSGGITLPNPANDKLWYNFQYRFETSPLALIQQLYLTTIDMTGDGGLGKVIDKQNAVIEDSLTGMYSAVRHGNGRDWWVVVPRGTNRSFWRMQITPQGVQPAILQTLPPPYSPFDYTIIVDAEQPPYIDDTIPVVEYTSEVNNGQADFSPDGRVYARIIPYYGDVEIYDFNRCTGLLRLRRVFPVPRSLYPPAPTDPDYTLPSACGLSFSPDSRYLYFSNTGGLYQLDLADNTSDYVLVGTYTGFQDRFIYVNFFQMHLAPDGKIYMGAGNSARYLHVIDHPNEAGLACGFRERGLELPRWTSWTINYFPNFNLYDDPYGGCDSLGINDPNYSGAPLFEEFKVFPNPASAGLIKVYVPPCASARVSVFSIDGKLLYEMKEVTGNVIYGIDCSDWASGVYVVTAYLDGGKPVSKPVFVTH